VEKNKMMKTKEWAESHGIDTQDVLPPIEDYDEPYKQTAEVIAVRSIILHAVSAVGHGVHREPIVEWFKNQSIWDQVSPREQNFLLSQKPRRLLEEDRRAARWLQEAQWALLWTIQKVESIGLPIKTCDTTRLAKEIMPELGYEIQPFISSAKLRPAPTIRAEDDRIYRLYREAQQAYESNEAPDDLVYGVLFQRNYAFEWLRSGDDWDDVKMNT
jgi:hypothetical protein